MPSSRNKNKALCSLSSLQELDTKGFKVKIKRKTADIFVVKKEGVVYGYQNECPHARSPLEWNPDEFLDNEKAFIQCTFHGALFEIESGKCVSGPCNGVGLKPVALDVEGGEVFLAKS